MQISGIRPVQAWDGLLSQHNGKQLVGSVTWFHRATAASPIADHSASTHMVMYTQFLPQAGDSKFVSPSQGPTWTSAGLPYSAATLCIAVATDVYTS